MHHRFPEHLRGTPRAWHMRGYLFEEIAREGLSPRMSSPPLLSPTESQFCLTLSQFMKLPGALLRTMERTILPAQTGRED